MAAGRKPCVRPANIECKLRCRKISHNPPYNHLCHPLLHADVILAIFSHGEFAERERERKCRETEIAKREIAEREIAEREISERKIPEKDNSTFFNFDLIWPSTKTGARA